MKKKFDFFGLRTIYDEHKGHSKQIMLLAVNSLKKTYKGAILGFGWAIIKPAFTLFILWFAFHIGLKGSKEVHGFTTFVFLLVGYIPWFYISEAILKGAKSIRTNKQFVTKISFPVSNIMTFEAVSFLIIHLFLMLIMYAVLLFMGYEPSIFNLQFLYYCPMMFAFFLCLSWTTSVFAALSKDFENLINSIMTGLFWLSGIIWDSYSIQPDWLRKLMYFNPINYFANGYRKSFLYGEFIFDSNYTTETVIFFAEFLFVIIIGSINYKRLRKTLPDVL